MIKVGDYVTFTGYEELRGIILEGPRIVYNRSQYRVMWEEAGKPEHWSPRPTGSWEDGSNIKVLSSLEIRWV
jgi:hypothetical protein